MFLIESANLSLLGRSVTYYAMAPIAAAAAITAVNSTVAWKKKLDASFVFRVSLLLFTIVAVGQLLFQNIPDILLPVMYVVSACAVLFGFWAAGVIFGHDGKNMLKLGICSVPLFSFFSKMGCFLTGCCYGRPYDGFLSVVYGTDTQNPVPGTPRFPIQLLTALAFLVLAAAAYVAFLKGRKLSVFVGILFLDWFIYYCGTCLYDQSANQMIIKGFNTALPLAITSGFAGIFTMCQTHRKGYEN